MKSRLFFDHYDYNAFAGGKVNTRHVFLPQSADTATAVAKAKVERWTPRVVEDSFEKAALPNQRAQDGEKIIHFDFERLAQERVYAAATDKTSLIAMASYKALRTQVLQALEMQRTNCLMVVGPDKNVGKTLTSINLAVMIARQKKKKVILADFDLRSPSLSDVLGFKAREGVGDIASGFIDLADALWQTNIEGLAILPGAKRYQDSSELLVSNAMKGVYEELKAKDDTIVILDTPPVLGCDDVKALTPHVQASLVVVRQDVTSRKELRHTLALLGEPSNIVGITVNRSNEGDFNAYYY